jgi:DNA invertase Pin-like site-specific DNA recombinase
MAGPKLQNLLSAHLETVYREITTRASLLSRSQKEVNELIVLPGIRVHVVSLNRQVGKTKMLSLAKQAEAEGVKISQDTKTALSKKKASGVRLGAPKSVLEKATRSSTKQAAIAAWNTVTEIVRFISADPLRRDMTRRELVGALNKAGHKTARGRMWTIDALTRPLRKARAQLKLEDEPDEGPAGFDDVHLA